MARQTRGSRVKEYAIGAALGPGLGPLRPYVKSGIERLRKGEKVNWGGFIKTIPEDIAARYKYGLRKAWHVAHSEARRLRGVAESMEYK